MHELPRQLSVDELTELFSGRTPLVERLAEVDDPLGQGAQRVIAGLPDDDKFAALAAHPRIGERSPEQHGDDPAVLEELARLNAEYEERFGFRFVVFVNRRSRTEIVPVLRARMERTREEELATNVEELVAIARARWEEQRWTGRT
jgi:2-oxo-4-hydroxy-4-carboxy--5-ureidoimidazoline (OHCU) decarboxylase